jgi:hypothetical protein
MATARSMRVTQDGIAAFTVVTSAKDNLTLNNWATVHARYAARMPSWIHSRRLDDEQIWENPPPRIREDDGRALGGAVIDRLAPCHPKA